MPLPISCHHHTLESAWDLSVFVERCFADLLSHPCHMSQLTTRKKWPKRKIWNCCLFLQTMFLSPIILGRDIFPEFKFLHILFHKKVFLLTVGPGQFKVTVTVWQFGSLLYSTHLNRPNPSPYLHQYFLCVCFSDMFGYQGAHGNIEKYQEILLFPR